MQEEEPRERRILNPEEIANKLELTDLEATFISDAFQEGYADGSLGSSISKGYAEQNRIYVDLYTVKEARKIADNLIESANQSEKINRRSANATLALTIVIGFFSIVEAIAVAIDVIHNVP